MCCVTETKNDVFAGVLLGTAVGDALGLPAEGLSPARIRKRWRGNGVIAFSLDAA